MRVLRFFLAFCLALLPAFSQGASTNRILTVDQDGNVSSTNALATQAQLAMVAHSNNLVKAQQAAVADGYNSATQWLAYAAQSITTIPTIFQSVEFVGFAASVKFSKDAKCYITGLERTSDVEVKNGVSCNRVTLTFGFTESLQTVQPFIEYSPQLDGTPRAEWDFLADGFVEAPVAISGTFTDTNSVQYTNLYTMDAWVPSEHSAGFFGIQIPNDAVIADGTVMDMPGIKGGLEGEIQWDNIKVNYVGGYAVTGSQDN